LVEIEIFCTVCYTYAAGSDHHGSVGHGGAVKTLLCEVEKLVVAVHFSQL
jgi:hypothetical protein